MIPAFTPSGVLPPSSDGTPYQCSRDEMEQRFVIEFDSPDWRRVLFDGWDLLRNSIAELAPSARWWIWGSLITTVEEPLFGDRASVNALVIVPMPDIPQTPERLALLLGSVHSAEELHRVDAALVLELPTSHAGHHVTTDELRFWRRRSTVTIVDITTREMVPAGFIEVMP